jgi:hypothetical protein
VVAAGKPKTRTGTDANEVIFHTFQTKSAVDKLERGSVSRTNIHRDNIIAMG